MSSQKSNQKCTITVAERKKTIILQMVIFDNITNDTTYRKRLIECKAYIMKSEHSEKDRVKFFFKTAIILRTETLKNKST